MMWSLFGGLPFPLGAKDRLRNLLWNSLDIPYNQFTLVSAIT